ncbi:MAG: histidine phosphatase family protein [Cyclobacteriaceae bacterium]|nr:histidine phosphatase family protein [Cyclobacteriaceae bacterium]MCH8517161.1 histidine phosphatase family protein [Cyclobacteriaceae bacterium]
MKRLILMRHAEAEEGGRSVTDKNRSLSQKGFGDAAYAGQYIRSLGFENLHIFTSSATRTVQTAQLIAEQLKLDQSSIKVSDELYNPSVRSLFDFITMISESVESAVIISHNPSLIYLVEYLVNDTVGSFYPADLKFLSLELNQWSALSKGGASIEYTFSPMSERN